MEAKDSEERGRAIVQTLALVVESMVQPSESVPPAHMTRTKFEAFRAPGISVRDYLMRINKYASCSPECFVLALVYIDRLHQAQGLILTDLNVHRVLITSVVLAAKFFDDHYFNNAYYAKVGGVPCGEMNELEVEFLLLVNFTLHVSTDTYVRYYSELANHYIANSLPGSHPRFRLAVVMDPEQVGQLIYVEDVEEEEEPQARLSYDEQEYQRQLQEQQQRQYEEQLRQQQVHAQNVYAYQQPAAAETYQQPTVTAPYQQPATTAQYEQPAATAAYQQPVATTQYQQPAAAVNPYASHYPDHQSQQGIYHYHQPPQHAQVYNPYNHQSSIDHGGEAHYTAATTAPLGMHAKHAHSGASSSSASNGIVYASTTRKSGQKRRQSVALGVNA